MRDFKYYRDCDDDSETITINSYNNLSTWRKVEVNIYALMFLGIGIYCVLYLIKYILPALFSFISPVTGAIWDFI